MSQENHGYNPLNFKDVLIEKESGNLWENIFMSRF